MQLPGPPRLMVPSSWVFGQTKRARRCLEIAHVCVFAVVPIVAARSFQGSAAARRFVELIADAVPLELGSFPLELGSAPDVRGAAATPPVSAAAAAAPAAVRLTVGSCVVRLPAAAKESGPFLQRLVPSFLCFPR